MNQLFRFLNKSLLKQLLTGICFVFLFSAYSDTALAQDTSSHSASYSGNMFKYIQDNIHYPTDAKAKEVQGNVIVTIQIDSSGNMTSPVVTKSIHSSLDAEALRVVNTMTTWYPAKLHGVATASSYQVNVLFKL